MCLVLYSQCAFHLVTSYRFSIYPVSCSVSNGICIIDKFFSCLVLTEIKLAILESNTPIFDSDFTNDKFLLFLHI